MRASPIVGYLVHKRDKDNRKMKPITDKNNLLLNNMYVFSLMFPSKSQNTKSKKEIVPAFPGNMEWGRAIEKLKNQAKKNIILFGLSTFKINFFIIKSVL